MMTVIFTVVAVFFAICAIVDHVHYENIQSSFNAIALGAVFAMLAIAWK
jgi:hypothetical protein